MMFLKLKKKKKQNRHVSNPTKNAKRGIIQNDSTSPSSESINDFIASMSFATMGECCYNKTCSHEYQQDSIAHKRPSPINVYGANSLSRNPHRHSQNSIAMPTTTNKTASTASTVSTSIATASTSTATTSTATASTTVTNTKSTICYKPTMNLSMKQLQTMSKTDVINLLFTANDDYKKLLMDQNEVKRSVERLKEQCAKKDACIENYMKNNNELMKKNNELKTKVKKKDIKIKAHSLSLRKMNAKSRRVQLSSIGIKKQFT